MRVARTADPTLCEPKLLLRLLNVTQEIENGGVEALRLLNLRKMTTIVEQDCRGSLQFSFENPGVIRRHELVLSSPDNQSWLLHRGHCGLQHRNRPAPTSAERDQATERPKNCLLGCRRRSQAIPRSGAITR